MISTFVSPPPPLTSRSGHRPRHPWSRSAAREGGDEPRMARRSRMFGAAPHGEEAGGPPAPSGPPTHIGWSWSFRFTISSLLLRRFSLGLPTRPDDRDVGQVSHPVAAGTAGSPLRALARMSGWET